VTGDGWFLDESRYWVPGSESGAYPVRQGDLIAGFAAEGGDWAAAQIVHPTCDLGKPSVEKIQVARVRPLSALSDDFSRSLVTAGYREVDGRRKVAVAHTSFLAPWSDGGEPSFVNFREIASIDRRAASQESRIVTMAHDCRVAWMRRWIYFRLRLPISYGRVREMEAMRISADPMFEGPKPAWAAPDG